MKQLTAGGTRHSPCLRLMYGPSPDPSHPRRNHRKRSGHTQRSAAGNARAGVAAAGEVHRADAAEAATGG